MIRAGILTVLIVSALQAQGFNPGLVEVSGGSWMVFSSNRAPEYTGIFSSLSAAWYPSYGIWKAGLHVPVVWSYESSGRQRVFPGDAKLYVGPLLRAVNPRLGLIVPLGYGLSSTWSEKAWIGTNNLMIQGGLALGREPDKEDGVPLSFEIMAATPLTEGNAYLKRGSVTAHMNAKTYWNAGSNWQLGIELLATGGRMLWIWQYEAEPGVFRDASEIRLSVVPYLWVVYRTGRALSATVKAGAGPSFSRANDGSGFSYVSNNINISAGVQWYP